MKKILAVIICAVIGCSMLVGCGGSADSSSKARVDNINSLGKIEMAEYLMDIVFPSKCKINQNYYNEKGGRVFAMELDMSKTNYEEIFKNYDTCDYDEKFNTVDNVEWWSLDKNVVSQAYVCDKEAVNDEKKTAKAYIFLTSKSDNEDRVIVNLLYTE